MKTGNKLTKKQVELLHWMRNSRAAHTIRMWDLNNRINDIAEDYEKIAVQNYALRKQNAILRNKIKRLSEQLKNHGGKDE